MKRKVQNPEPKTSKPARIEPLAEGIERSARDRKWRSISDDDLVAFARAFIAEMGLNGRRELEKADAGLYIALWKRKLLDGLGLPDLRGEMRDWKEMGRDGLAAYAKTFIAERGIRGRKELRKADEGLYKVLYKKKILDELGLPDLRGERRDWKEMGRDGLAAYAKTFIAERGIRGRKELARADVGLYDALRESKLLDGLGLLEKSRHWRLMERDEMAAYAKRFIAERGIRGRAELARADNGLYQALWVRGLVDEAFSDLESSAHAEAVDGVLGALETFGDEK